MTALTSRIAFDTEDRKLTFHQIVVPLYRIRKFEPLDDRLRIYSETMNLKRGVIIDLMCNIREAFLCDRILRQGLRTQTFACSPRNPELHFEVYRDYVLQVQCLTNPISLDITPDQMDRIEEIVRKFRVICRADKEEGSRLLSKSLYHSMGSPRKNEDKRETFSEPSSYRSSQYAKEEMARRLQRFETSPPNARSPRRNPF